MIIISLHEGLREMVDKELFIAKVEYKECRSAILNFDKILTDLRIKGITLILAFSGAAALTGQKVLVLKLGSIIINAAIVIQLVTLVLIYSVYKLDKMYTMFLVSAVDRARAIEQKFSEKLPLKNPDEQFPFTETTGKDHEGKFKMTSRGHWAFLLSAVDRTRAIKQKFSKKLPLKNPDGQFPLTETIRTAYKEKFNTISRGHWMLYKILAFISVILTIFYYLAEVVG